MSAFIGVFLAMAFFGIIFLAIMVVYYLLFAFGLYGLAKKANIENPWVAFIPIAQLYILGMLVKNVKIQDKEIPSLELVLPLGYLAMLILNRIPLIGFLLSIAYLVLFALTIYKLYSEYRPESAVLWLILSIFILPILVFIMRNDSPVNIAETDTEKKL